jgi:tetratricopeptide (TPR) repeat protein
MAALRRAVAADARSADAHYWLAVAYAEQGARATLFRQPVLARHVKAELERALTIDPAHVRARSDLARFLMAAPALLGGSRAGAREQARALARWSPYRAAILRGWLAHHDGDRRTAEREFRAAVAAQPDSAPGYFALGHLLHDQGRHDEAFAAFSRGLALRPDHMPAYFTLGFIGAETGTHLAEAERALLHYVAYEPRPGEPRRHSTHYRLGMIYEKQGRYDLARRQYQEARRLSRNSDYREALARMR